MNDNNEELISIQHNEEIDENKLNELDRELSHYLGQICREEDHSQHLEYDYEANQNQRVSELEQFNLTLHHQNQKLSNKIEEYLQLNREWESKVYNIKKVLNELEEKNNSLIEDNERLKDENEQINFKLKFASEKEKINDANTINLKELQSEYEIKTKELKKEFKIKDENLKRKYEQLEEILNKKIKDQEDDFNDIIERLSNQNKLAHDNNERLEKINEELKQKQIDTERFLQAKEQEFEDVMLSKDRKLKELEQCIKSISEEANGQINKLCDSVAEFNEKIGYYKQRELQITKEYMNLKNQMSSLTADIPDNSTNNIKNLDYSNMNMNKSPNTKKYSSNSIGSSELLNNNNEYPQSKLIDTLRNKVKQLEEENLYLSRELNLKYEESDTLTEELRISYDTLKSFETNTQLLVREKEDQIANLINKINELDILVNKYGQSLNIIKKSFDKTLQDNQLEMVKKNNEMRQMQETYERKLRDLQKKLETVLLKENMFVQRTNDNMQNLNNMNKVQTNYNSNTNERYEYNCNYAYVPKEIPDDEEVRKNINEQINYIKEKLDRNYFN